jgi:hypothetical protein
MEEIFMAIAMIVIFFLGRRTRKKYIESKRGLMIFFFLFLSLITAFTIDLINNFTYTKLLIIAFIFVSGVIDYYKRAMKMGNKLI